MSDKPAAIEAQLVDVRNVAAHKCIRLELHVPAEQAGLVLAAFGWPTAVDPVPVALARLGVPEQRLPLDELLEGMTPEQAHPETQVSPPRERIAFADRPPSQQAALRCNDLVFRRFLSERLGTHCGNAAEAAIDVRSICDVTTRSALNTEAAPAEKWRALDDEFFKWQRGAR